MKRLFLTFSVSAMACLSALAQETNAAPATSTNAVEPVRITAALAKDNIGTNAIVTGKIADVYSRSMPIRLNFDKPYPNQTFTAVIFGNKTNLFPEVDKVKGSTVEVSGTITAYHEHPQIILTNSAQLKVLEKPAEAEQK